MMWISGFVFIFSTFFLMLILRMKKTDPVFGCDKYMRKGCDKVSGRECGYPDCAMLEKHHSGGR